MEAVTTPDPRASPYRVYRLEGLPPEAIYVPNFITKYEEEYLLKRVRSRSSYILVMKEENDTVSDVADR
jgi:hypothetical protein